MSAMYSCAAVELRTGRGAGSTALCVMTWAPDLSACSWQSAVVKILAFQLRIPPNLPAGGTDGVLPAEASVVGQRLFFLTKQTYVVDIHTRVVIILIMALPKLTKLELQIMEALWNLGASSIREIQEAFPERDRPAYTTVQTTVYRMERKKILRRSKKISNAHIFEAVISRNAAQGRLIDELLGLFGGRTQPVMAHLVESGKLTLEDVKEAERLLRESARKSAVEKQS